MRQVAVFVDAGYVYAQGAALLTGQPLRKSVRLNVKAAVDAIKGSAASVCPQGRLLRIYWYDGMPRGGLPSANQREAANEDFVKLRLGTINSRGQQKGVDSLIVTDMIDLARNRAMSDVLLLSGDEDLRVGVQIAQTYGVQVHLLGIGSARGSQSPDLVREADTRKEWGKAEIRQFLFLRQPPHGSSSARTGQPGSASTGQPLAEVVDEAIAMALRALQPDEQRGIVERAQGSPNEFLEVPPDIDRPTLAKIRDRLGRPLTDEERMQYRARFMEALARTADRPK